MVVLDEIWEILFNQFVRELINELNQSTVNIDQSNNSNDVKWLIICDAENLMWNSKLDVKQLIWCEAANLLRNCELPNESDSDVSLAMTKLVTAIIVWWIREKTRSWLLRGSGYWNVKTIWSAVTCSSWMMGSSMDSILRQFPGLPRFSRGYINRSFPGLSSMQMLDRRSITLFGFGAVTWQLGLEQMQYDG